MDYNNWNSLLAAHFFNPAMKDRQVLLHVTPELLQSILAAQTKTEPTTKQAVSDFCRAVSTKGRRDICQEVCNWALDTAWLDHRLQFPPYLAFLSAFVLLLTTEDGPLITKTGNGYYNPLNSLLRNNGYTGTPVRCAAFARTKDAWLDLETWSMVTKQKSLGYYKFRSVGGWVNVGMPAAQALVRTEDRSKLEGLFERYNRHQDLSPNRLKQDLNASPWYLTTTTHDLLFEGDEGVKAAVTELLLELWEEYKARPAKVRIPPKRRTSVSVAGGGGSRLVAPQASASILLASLQDYNSGKDLLCLTIRLEAADPAPDELHILQADRHWVAERFRQDGATNFYGPIYSPSETTEEIEYLLFSHPQKDFQIASQNGTYLLTEDDTDEPVAFLEAESEASAVEWLQTEPTHLETGKHYRVLLRSEGEGPGIAAFLDANRRDGGSVREVICANTPKGCSLYAVSVQSLENLNLPNPTPSPSTGLRLVGGIRACDGNSSRYLFFAPPSAECSSTCGVAANTANGTRVQMKQPKDQNRFALPAELREPGELLLVPTGPDGHDAYGIAKLQITLVEPEMPSHYVHFPAGPFSTADSPHRSGAALDGPSEPPPFLFRPDSVSLEFFGADRLPGIQRSYRPEDLPSVRPLPSCLQALALECDGEVLAFGKEGSVNVADCRLAPGKHFLRLLWYGAPVGRPEVFQIRETPEFQISIDGACKLDGLPQQDPEYLIQREPVQLAIEPADNLVVKIESLKFEVFPIDLTQFLTNGSEVRLQLYWRNQFAEKACLRFIRQHPGVEASLTSTQPSPKCCLFPRHTLPELMTVVEPQHEHANIKLYCAGKECPQAPGQDLYSIPPTAPADKPLRITCRWRGVEIPCHSPQFQIADPPTAEFSQNGGISPHDGVFFQGALPSITLTPANPSVTVQVNGSTAILDGRGRIQNLDHLAKQGTNTITAEWLQKEIAHTAFEVVPAPPLELTLQGGTQIAPGEYLLWNDRSPLPEIAGVPPGASILCNGKPLPQNTLTTGDCAHGQQVLQCGVSPVKKRFTVWKEFWLLGATQGEMATNQHPPAWTPVWIISKFGRECRAALFPGGPATMQPVQNNILPKKLRREWCDKIRESELVASPPAVRELWRTFKERAKAWK